MQISSFAKSSSNEHPNCNKTQNMEILGLPYKRFIFYILYTLVLNLIILFFYYRSLKSEKKNSVIANAKPAESKPKTIWDKLKIIDHKGNLAEWLAIIVTFTNLSSILDAWVTSIFEEYLYWYIFLPYGIILMIAVFLVINKVVMPFMMKIGRRHEEG